MFIKKPKKGTYLKINGKSGCVKDLRAYSLESKTIWECRQFLKQLTMGNEPILAWVPRYRGIEGYEEANNLRFVKYLRSIEGMRRKVAKECKNTPLSTKSRYDAAKRKLLTKKHHDLIRNEMRHLTKLLTGHWAVRYYLKNLGKTDCERCRLWTFYVNTKKSLDDNSDDIVDQFHAFSNLEIMREK